MNNREILFRAWNIDNETMIYDQSWSSSHRFMTWSGIIYEKGVLLNYKFLQFTGILDKNKKMIYEGDIIKREYTECEFNDKGKAIDVTKTAYGIVIYCPSEDCDCEQVYGKAGHGKAGFEIKQLSKKEEDNAFYG